MAVLRALVEAGVPVDAEQLFESANRFHGVSRATVSRTLSFLRSVGLAELMGCDAGRATYGIVVDAYQAKQTEPLGYLEARFIAPSGEGTPSIEPYAAMLSARGYMMNPERVAILRAFVRADGPVHAEQLLAETRRHFMVSRATVSRTLKLLHEVGIAKLAARDRKRCYYSLAGGALGIVLVDEVNGSVRRIEATGALNALHLVLAQEGFALSAGIEVRVRPLQSA
ncbi:transcriptional repressor [Brevundimonas diminuta]|uniref:transcriptional repressor n=1 Tax=Brevundimonas diminuta TaxID=293 RepID=UPI0032081643